MSHLNVQRPDSLYKNLQVLAQQDGISVDQFIAIDVAEKIAALTTETYLEDLAKRGVENDMRHCWRKFLMWSQKPMTNCHPLQINGDSPTPQQQHSRWRSLPERESPQPRSHSSDRLCPQRIALS
jgi:hypothetical protein